MANIEALNELIRVVRNTPDRDFNMSCWSCGTVGCALGRAAMDSYFQDRGLTLRMGVPKVDGFETAMSSAAALFDLKYPEMADIIWPSAYISSGLAAKVAGRAVEISRETVIARIQQTIDHHTLQRDAHLRAYRSEQTVCQIIEQATLAGECVAA